MCWSIDKYLSVDIASIYRQFNQINPLTRQDKWSVRIKQTSCNDTGAVYLKGENSV